MEYILWLIISFSIIGVLLFLSLYKKWKLKTCIYIGASVSLLSELLKIFTHMEYVSLENKSMGMVIEPTALPLHMCSIFIFFFFYLAFSKNEKINNALLSFITPVGLFGGLLAIFIATSGTNFKAPYSYQCFIYHSMLVWFSLYLLISKQVDLGIKAYIRNFIILFSLAIIMIWVNGALKTYDTNFFFVVRPPKDNLPILNLNHGWYVYFLTLSLIGIILLSVVHIPYIIKHKK